MKKNIKQRIIKGTSSVLAATIILISGGYQTITKILGIEKNNQRDILSNNQRTNTFKILEQTKKQENEHEIKLNINQIITEENTNIKQENKKYQYQYSDINSQEKDILYNLETTEPTSQEENINRLIRKRKKETKENINI